MASIRQTSSTPIRSPRTSPTYRKRTATTWCWPIRLSAVRSARKCSRTSPYGPARRRSSSSSTSSRFYRRGGVFIKNTFLSNTDNASVSLRKLLLESCNLCTVLDCPGGTFQGAGVKTVVLFFEKGTKTRTVWYHQRDPGRNLGKTNPLNDGDLAEFVALQKTFADSPKSWTVDAKSIDPATFDLSVKNPNGGEAVVHRSPQDIMDEIAALDAESAAVLETIRGLL